jgi:hypothetical protein
MKSLFVSWFKKCQVSSASSNAVSSTKLIPDFSLAGEETPSRARSPRTDPSHQTKIQVLPIKKSFDAATENQTARLCVSAGISLDFEYTRPDKSFFHERSALSHRLI